MNNFIHFNNIIYKVVLCLYILRKFLMKIFLNMTTCVINSMCMFDYYRCTTTSMVKTWKRLAETLTLEALRDKVKRANIAVKFGNEQMLLMIL